MLAGLIAIVLAQAVPAAGAMQVVPTVEPSLITNPAWVRKPRGQDYTMNYPEKAMRSGLWGRTIVECRVNAQGALNACSVIEESPLNYGFGRASLRLTAGFQMKPETTDGKPVDGRAVRIPIRFMVQGGRLDRLTVDLDCYGRVAAFLERTPTADPARAALTFFAVQLLLVDAEGRTTPSLFEDHLRDAQFAGERNPQADDGTRLQRCVDFANQVGVGK